MSLRVGRLRGKWEVDIHITGPDGKKIRRRKVAPVHSKSAAKRWGEARLNELMLELFGPPASEAEPEDEKSRVPTLAQFGPRFIDGYAKANRHKPGGIMNKESHLRIYLVPMFGKRRLDEIRNEDVQQLKAKMAKKAPATVNNVLTTLSRMLKVAVEWGVIEKMPCRVTLLKRVHTEMRFHDFDEYERLVAAANRVGPDAHLVVLLGGEAGLRCGEIVGLEWPDYDADRLQLRVARSIWRGHVNTPKSGKPRRIPLTDRLAGALATHRHLRSRRILCHRTGRFFKEKDVQRLVQQAERLANLDHIGVHALRHTFCSHLAMRGAPAKAIQELAGHSDLITTQRYMHLSPAEKDKAIHLLNKRPDREDAAPAAVQIFGKEAAS